MQREASYTLAGCLVAKPSPPASCHVLMFTLMFSTPSFSSPSQYNLESKWKCFPHLSLLAYNDDNLRIHWLISCFSHSMEVTGCIRPAAYTYQVRLQAMPWCRVRRYFDSSADTKNIFLCPQVSWWFYQKHRQSQRNTLFQAIIRDGSSNNFVEMLFPDKLGLRHAEGTWNVRRAVTPVPRVAVFQLSWFFK